MTPIARARSAYASATRIAPAPRDTEYRAFAEVTRRLADHEMESDLNFPRLAEALHLNRRLWGLLATDVARSGNGLPEELRAQILSLYEFVRQHSDRVLSERSSPAVLVEINTAVMRGLRTLPDIPASELVT